MLASNNDMLVMGYSVSFHRKREHLRQFDDSVQGLVLVLRECALLPQTYVNQVTFALVSNLFELGIQAKHFFLRVLFRHNDYSVLVCGSIVC